MNATTKALRALSPKRTTRPRLGSGDDESDASPVQGSSPTASQGQQGSSRHHRGARQRRRRRSSAASEQLPEAERSEEDFRRDWGISREREEILLVEFRKQIEAEAGPLKPHFDKYYLRRFLRARQHDLGRAKDMFLAHLKWRQDNGIDGILQDFVFQERDAFLSLYPQGYHKTDKMGRPIYIQHMGAIRMRALQEITTEDRMLSFHVQEYERCLKYIFPACSKKAERHIDQTFAIMDVKGVGLKHFTGDVKTILSRITSTDQNNYPETLGKTVIINAPTVFKMIWAFVRPMLDVRTQNKIELAPSDYMKVLLKYVDAENIPEYLGGQSKGSLIDDVGPWKDPALRAEVDADIELRDRGGGGSESMELEGGGSSSVLLSPQHSLQYPQADQHQQQPRGASPSGGGSISLAGVVEGRSPTPDSPFVQHSVAISTTQAPLGGAWTDSEADEFQDARSRRQSILSSPGSSAYLSAADDDSEFYTPKHDDAPTVSASGPSFHSDQPLLASAGASPEGKLGSGSAATTPQQQQHTLLADQREQQQQQPVAFKYSDEYPPSPLLDQQGGRAAVAGRALRGPLMVVLPAASASGEQQHSVGSSGGAEVSIDGRGGITAQTNAAAYGTPSSVPQQQWNPKQEMAGGVPSPPLQIPILARVRALEEKLPERERGLRRYLPPGGELPSKSIGQGTLLSRVDALERAMDALLRAQDTALDEQQHQRARANGSEAPRSSGCCSGCSIM